MKLLCFLADLDGGGAERSMLNLCRGFLDKGLQPVLAFGRGDGPARRWADPRLRLINLGAPRARQALLPLRRLLTKERPELVFATKLDANLIAAIAVSSLGASRPRLVLRETNSHEARGDLSALRRAATARAYRFADRIVALSNGVGTELEEAYSLPAGKVVRISNPVNVDDIAAAAAVARTLPPPIVKPGKLIVAIGRLTKQKGFDFLLPAFAQVASRNDRLAILGEGEDRGKLEAQVKALGIAERIVMPGFVKEPERWLAHADMFVLSSRWEGFGHVIVEAMASGVPVIATDCPFGPRDIIENEVTGLLVPPFDAKALAGAMSRMLSDADFSARLGTAGCGSVGRFSRENISSRYLEVFRDVLESARLAGKSPHSL